MRFAKFSPLRHLPGLILELALSLHGHNGSCCCCREVVVGQFAVLHGRQEGGHGHFGRRREILAVLAGHTRRPRVTGGVSILLAAVAVLVRVDGEAKVIRRGDRIALRISGGGWGTEVVQVLLLLFAQLLIGTKGLKRGIFDIIRGIYGGWGSSRRSPPVDHH